MSQRFEKVKGFGRQPFLKITQKRLDLKEVSPKQAEFQSSTHQGLPMWISRDCTQSLHGRSHNSEEAPQLRSLRQAFRVRSQKAKREHDRIAMLYMPLCFADILLHIPVVPLLRYFSLRRKREVLNRRGKYTIWSRLSHEIQDIQRKVCAFQLDEKHLLDDFVYHSMGHLLWHNYPEVIGLPSPIHRHASIQHR